jgi:glycosyltransferase involved in cell wall biosynthesis
MISFIIPAYNEEKLIGATVDAIVAAARAVREPFEVIVVDDASTDRTAAVAEAQGARVVPVNRRQIAATRNAGARAARGDVFIFVDADTIMPQATLRAALAALRSGAVGGGSRVRFDGMVPRYARVLLPVFSGLLGVLRIAAGCFIFCRREAFEATGGFNERLFASEEVDMSRALGRHGCFVVLREQVITSGRKLRQYSAGQILGLSAHLILKGRRGLANRDALGIWYDGRREE